MPPMSCQLCTTRRTRRKQRHWVQKSLGKGTATPCCSIFGRLVTVCSNIAPWLLGLRGTEWQWDWQWDLCQSPTLCLSVCLSVFLFIWLSNYPSQQTAHHELNVNTTLTAGHVSPASWTTLCSAQLSWDTHYIQKETLLVWTGEVWRSVRMLGSDSGLFVHAVGWDFFFFFELSFKGLHLHHTSIYCSDMTEKFGSRTSGTCMGVHSVCSIGL